MTFINLYFNKVIFFLLYTFIILYPSGPFISDAIITLLGLSIIISLNNKKVFFELLNQKFIIVIILFYISINISSFLSEYSYISFSRSITFFRWILFLIFAYLSIGLININKINLAVVFITLFCIFDSIFQYFFQYDLFGFSTISSSPAVNSDYELLTGPFGDEPIVSSFIVRLLFPTIYFFLLTKNKHLLKYKFTILFFIIFLCLFVVLFSGQRISIVFLIIGFFLFLLLNLKYIISKFSLSFKFFKYFIIIISSLLILITATLFKLSNNSQYSNRIVDGFKNEFINYVSGESHYAKLHQISYNIYSKNKLFGSGLKSFRYICVDDEFTKEKFNTKEICSTHPHNYYIEIIAETGIIGLALIIIFFIIIIFKYLSYKMKNTIPTYADGYFITFCIFIFPLVPTGSFFSNYNSALFWFILSLLIINIHKGRNV